MQRCGGIAAATTVLSPFLFGALPRQAAQAADDLTKVIPISASWSAVDGLNSLDKGKKIVGFDRSAYYAMKDDPSRTPLFKKAIIDRLNAAPGGPSTQTVLDLGTGPFALFSIMAAEAGAKKVYAIEANKEVAQSARILIKQSGFSDIITVLDGVSTELTLPDNEKVDLVVAELVGSIATEEGAYATVLDAHTRFVKKPNSPKSWIPSRIQTYAAPASYTLHNLFQPPAFDWNKLAGEPVRFNCRDEGLQLLSDPVLVEDVSFADIPNNVALSKKDDITEPRQYTFTVDGERIKQNTVAFREEYRKNKVIKDEELEELAVSTARSFTGVAFWPRILMDDEKDSTNVINSRSFPEGGHQRSHWQTVLPIMNSTPVGGLKSGDKVIVNADFDVPSKVLVPPKYRLAGKIFRAPPVNAGVLL